MGASRKMFAYIENLTPNLTGARVRLTSGVIRAGKLIDFL
jgi:hypothetical protein